MSAEPTQIRSIIQNARESLLRGDQSEARRWAEQAARLAPELEDSWLLMAACSSPRTSLSYAQRALAINPQSQRAQKAVEWARNRPGAEAPSVGAPTAMVEPGVPSKGIEPEAQKIPKRRSPLFPILLAGLACVVVIFAAWSVSKSSALASIVRNVNEPAATGTLELNFAMAEVSKPTYTPAWTFTPSFTPTLTYTPTSSITPTPSITPTLEFTSTPLPTETPLPTDTPGVMEVAILPDTPTPIAPPTSAYVPPTQQAYVPPSSSGGNGAHWIDINLSTQQLFAYEGDGIVRTFIVSTGVSSTPTVTGKYKIYARYLSANMHGPGYFLPDVPYTMYFYKSYGIHGTYWHNNFGTPMSHGCVNMSIPDAEWIYYWSTFGTVVNVHY
jgi:lipoprotein-anchoring transpeptidase ErfK/SrfK